ncbi:MAG: 50S ribosomal protein L35 [Pseudomonadota bacterium]
MPKMKTRRSAAKRFRKTGTGKIRRATAYASHILTKKNRKRKRRLKKNNILESVDAKKVKQLLPYL